MVKQERQPSPILRLSGEVIVLSDDSADGETHTNAKSSVKTRSRKRLAEDAAVAKTKRTRFQVISSSSSDEEQGADKDDDGDNDPPPIPLKRVSKGKSRASKKHSKSPSPSPQPTAPSEIQADAAGPSAHLPLLNTATASLPMAQSMNPCPPEVPTAPQASLLTAQSTNPVSTSLLEAPTAPQSTLTVPAHTMPAQIPPPPETSTTAHPAVAAPYLWSDPQRWYQNPGGYQPHGFPPYQPPPGPYWPHGQHPPPLPPNPGNESQHRQPPPQNYFNYYGQAPTSHTPYYHNPYGGLPMDSTSPNFASMPLPPPGYQGHSDTHSAPPMRDLTPAPNAEKQE
jgi:hypothetical protein